jgi:hypothetical protein
MEGTEGEKTPFFPCLWQSPWQSVFLVWQSPSVLENSLFIIIPGGGGSRACAKTAFSGGPSGKTP